MPDEIIKELWEIKDTIATEHGNDVEVFVYHLRSKERLDREGVVDLNIVRTTAEQGAADFRSALGGQTVR